MNQEMDPESKPSRRRPTKWYLFSLLAVVAIVGLNFGSSDYANDVLNPSELTHFFVPFPAGTITRPGIVPNSAGGSVFTRPIVVDVEKQGLLKRKLNPWVIGVSTHWLVNTGNDPVRIGLRLTDAGYPIRWEVGSGIEWDGDSKTFLEPIEPGQMVPELGIDWFWHIPDDVRPLPLWYRGNLTVFEADTGQPLTVIPITISNGPLASSKPAWGGTR